MNKREFRNRSDVVIRLLSVLINSLGNQTSTAFLNAVQFRSLSLNSYNPVFSCFTLLTRYISFLLKPFRYCINIIKFICVIFEIFSREHIGTLQLRASQASLKSNQLPSSIGIDRPRARSRRESRETRSINARGSQTGTTRGSRGVGQELSSSRGLWSCARVAR